MKAKNVPRTLKLELVNSLVFFKQNKEEISTHSALMVNLIKFFQKRKQLLQHECLTPIESGITSSQILQIQNQLD